MVVVTSTIHHGVTVYRAIAHTDANSDEALAFPELLTLLGALEGEERPGGESGGSPSPGGFGGEPAFEQKPDVPSPSPRVGNPSPGPPTETGSPKPAPGGSESTFL